jgi:hypothetical protein
MLQFAVTFDLLASVAANELRVGNPAYLANDSWLTEGLVRLRFVRRRGRGYAEYVEDRSRATRVASDGDVLFSLAAGRCGPREGLIRKDVADEVIDWRIPSVD